MCVKLFDVAAATPPQPKPLGVVPQQRRSVEKRQRVLDAALKEFARHGVEAARVDTIVAEADVAWGTFFHYFPRKEDVLLAAGVDQQRHFEAALDEAAADGATSVRDIVFAGYQAWTVQRYPQRLLVEIAREILASPNRFERMLDPGGALLYNRIATLLEVGQRRGEVRADVEPVTMARILNGSILLTFSRVGISGGAGLPRDVDLTELVRTTFRVIWAGIEIQAEGRPHSAGDSR
jgi:AcrR family transcriptional regulator